MTTLQYDDDAIFASLSTAHTYSGEWHSIRPLLVYGDFRDAAGRPFLFWWQSRDCCFFSMATSEMRSAGSIVHFESTLEGLQTLRAHPWHVTLEPLPTVFATREDGTFVLAHRVFGSLCGLGEAAEFVNNAARQTRYFLRHLLQSARTADDDDTAATESDSESTPAIYVQRKTTSERRYRVDIEGTSHYAPYTVEGHKRLHRLLQQHYPCRDDPAITKRIHSYNGHRYYRAYIGTRHISRPHTRQGFNELYDRVEKYLAQK